MFCFVCLVIINTEYNWKNTTQGKLMNKLTLFTNMSVYISKRGWGASVFL